MLSFSMRNLLELWIVEGNGFVMDNTKEGMETHRGVHKKGESE